MISISNVGTYNSFYRQEHKTSRKERVTTRDLQGVLSSAGNPNRVDLLKMDCEGAEMEAILAADHATLRRFSTIAFEYHDFSGIAIDKVAAHLQGAGFSPLRLTHDSGGDSGLAWYIQR